jgi:hypothetical protein
MPAITVDNPLVLPRIPGADPGTSAARSVGRSFARPPRSDGERAGGDDRRTGAPLPFFPSTPTQESCSGVGQAARRGASAVLQATTWSSIVVT